MSGWAARRVSPACWMNGQIRGGRDRCCSAHRCTIRNGSSVSATTAMSAPSRPTARARAGRSSFPISSPGAGSALVIDPKGQNALVTALARGKGGKGLTHPLGQTVRILDPLGEIRDPLLQDCKARFNPLAGLDPGADDYAERVELIADALVVPDTKAKDNFFDISARVIISGLIDYVVMSPDIPKEDKHLGTVRDLLIHPDGPPLESNPEADPPFRGMEEMGGLAQAAASLVLQAGKNATGDVIATAISAYEMAGQHGHAPDPRRVGL